MRGLFLLPCLILAISAGVINTVNEVSSKLAGANTYYGVDFSQAATHDQMQCLATAGYSSAFVRAYTPAGNGAYDPYSCTNIHNAYPCIGTEVFMTPQPMSTKSGYVQFDEMYSGLKNGGVTLTDAWLQVVSPSHWKDVTSNIAFIQSVITRMRQYGIKPGIYTSQYDWNAITGNWGGAGQDVMLWYYHAPSNADFGDFVPFGSWQFPTVKQYNQQVSICGLTVNQDIFVSPSPNYDAFLAALRSASKDVKPEKYEVGRLGQ